MEGIISYILNENLIPFERNIVNPVESLILSQMSYFSFKEITDPIQLGKTKDLYSTDQLMDQVLNKKDNLEMLDCICKSKSWSNLEILDHHKIIDNYQEEQFSATTFKISDGIFYIAFSGTDFSFAGWKEDFNLTYMDHIPSQESAIEYTKMIMDRFPGKFYLGGHSKGGNLASYTLFNIEPLYVNRLIRVDNFDGPGINFKDQDLANVSEREHLLRKYLPENSVVGRIYEIEHCDSMIVKTSAKIIFDHDPHTWEVSGDHFVLAESTSEMSTFVYNTLKDLNENLDDTTKKDVLEDLYQILLGLEADDLGEVASNLASNLLAIYKSIKNQSPEEKEKLEMVRQALRTSIAENRPKILGI